MTSDTEYNFLETLKTVKVIDPYSIRKVFIILLRNFYSDPDNYKNMPNAFNKYIYTTGKDSSLKIEGDFRGNINDTQNSPGIYISAGPFQFKKDMVDNFAGNEIRNETTQRSMNVTAQINFNHIANDPDDVVILTTLTSAFLLTVSDIIRSTMNIKSLELNQILPVQLISGESAISVYSSSVVAVAQYENSWGVSMESNKIKKFQLLINK